MSEREREFSVCQFFANDTNEYVRRYVSAKEAVETFIRYTNNVASSLGIVERVIVTDGGDSIVLEWERGKGVTFPPTLIGKTLRPDWKARLDTGGEEDWEA